jgi:hypothetical protein
MGVDIKLARRSGGRWRDLPERLGDYRSVKRRSYRRIEMGVLDDMLETLAREADLEWLMIYSTIVRATSTPLARVRLKGADPRGLGWSRGGLSAKIHAATEGARASPPTDRLTRPAQRHRRRP